MDLKSAQEYSRQREELGKSVTTHEPAESPYESLPLNERFNWIWQAIDDLAGDELDRAEVTISGFDMDDSNLGIIFRRQFGEQRDGEIRKDMRTISVTWTYKGEGLALERLQEHQLKNVFIQHPRSPQLKKLRLVEESVIAAQKALHPELDQS